MPDPRVEDPSWKPKRDALRLKVCRNDEAALAFLDLVMDTVELWDDLIDQDKPVTARDINKVFYGLLIQLPMNPFFRANQAYLLPVLNTAINAWMDANDLEQSNKNLESAWYLKQFGIELYPAVAFLKGGLSWMREVGPEVRELLRHEPLEDYLKEKSHA